MIHIMNLKSRLNRLIVHGFDSKQRQNFFVAQNYIQNIYM